MDDGLSPGTETVVDSETGIVLQQAGSESESDDTSYSNMTVSVKNGTSKTGVAAKAAAALTELGFNTETGNANASNYKTTVIVYTNDSQKAAAEAICDKLGCGNVVKNSNNEYSYNTDILVVVGSDYKG